MRRSKNNKAILSRMGLSIAAALAAAPALGTTLYWDTNGATPGAATGASANGTWDATTTARWSTSSAGTAATSTYATANGGSPQTADVNFYAGSQTGPTADITISGAVVANSITVEDLMNITSALTTPSLTLGGGGNGGVTISSSAQGSTAWISSLPTTLAATQEWRNDSSFLFTVNGTITGTAAGAQTQALNITGTGAGGQTLSGIIADGAGGGNVAISVNTNAAAVTTLGGANTFTGGVALTQGILRTANSASSNRALGTGVLTLAGGELQLYRPGQTSGGSFGNNTVVTGSAKVTSGENSSAAGTTHTLGTLTIGAQTLTIAPASGVTSGTAGITFGATSLSGGVTGTTFNVLTGAKLSLGAVDGSGNLIKTGAGDMALTAGSPTFTGETVIKSGNTTGTITAFGSGVIRLGDATGSAAASLGINGGNNSNANRIIVQAGTSGALTILNTASGSNTSLSLSGAVTLNNNLILTAASSTGLTLSGSLSGTVASTISSQGGTVSVGSLGANVGDVIVTAGQLTLNAANTAFVGTVHVNGGTMVTGDLDATGLTNVIYVSSGTTFSRTGGGSGSVALEAIAGINDGTGGGGIVTRNGGGGSRPLEIGGSGTYNFSGSVQDTVSNAMPVIKTGVGIQNLSGANTYVAATSVVNGTLALLSTTGTMGATALKMQGGTFSFDSTGASTSRTQVLGALTIENGSSTIQSVYGTSGTDTLTFASFGGRSAGTAGNFVVSGGVNGSTHLINFTTQATGVTDRGVYFGGSNLAWYDGTSVRGVIWGVDGGTTTQAGGTSIAAATYAQTTADITAQATAVFTGINLVNSANAAQVFTLASGATVTTSGILRTGNGGSSSVTTISGGSTLRGASNTEVVIRTDGVNDQLAINTPITANGSNALSKSGAGTLVLGATNTYTGQTYVTGGVLSISSNANLGAVGSGATLNLNNGALRATASVALNNGGAGTNDRAVSLVNQGTFDVTGSATLSVSGVISDQWALHSNSSYRRGNLAKTGAGTLLISAAGTYVGGTAVNNGTLEVGSSGALGTGDVSVASGAILTLDGTSNMAIADTATLTLTSGGVVILNGATAAESVGRLVLGTTVFSTTTVFNAANSYNGFASYFAGSTSGGTLTVLPEPSSLGLALLAGSGLLRRKRFGKSR